MHINYISRTFKHFCRLLRLVLFSSWIICHLSQSRHWPCFLFLCPLLMPCKKTPIFTQCPMRLHSSRDPNYTSNWLAKRNPHLHSTHTYTTNKSHRSANYLAISNVFFVFVSYPLAAWCTGVLTCVYVDCKLAIPHRTSVECKWKQIEPFFLLFCFAVWFAHTFVMVYPLGAWDGGSEL